MFKFIKNILFVILLVLAELAQASSGQLTIFACEPEWGALAQEIASNKARITVATTALQDPHHIQARPSLIAAARQAELLFCTGAELEIGWLPILLEKASNPRILVNQTGHLMAADYVKLLDVPSSLDRANGDIHAQGNPHIQLNPYHYLAIADALTERLIKISPENQAYFTAKKLAFKQQWLKNIKTWEQQANQLHGLKVIVNHDNWVYLNNWLKINQLATLEPKPGIPPSTADLEGLIASVNSNHPAGILYANHESAQAANWLSQKTGIPTLALPFTVGANRQVDSLAGLFEDIINKLNTLSHVKH